MEEVFIRTWEPLIAADDRRPRAPLEVDLRDERT